MISTTLNVCVREALLEQGLSLHYYLKFLNFAISAFEEYNRDFPFNIKEVKVTPNAYFEVSLPADCLNPIKLSVAYNDRAHALDYDPSINGVANVDSEDNQIAWTHSEQAQYYIYAYENNINALGEYVGKEFGYVGTRKKAWRWIKERDVIQLTIDTDDASLYLMYQSEGFSTSTANVVHPFAKKMIKAFIHWKANEFGVIQNPLYVAREYKDQFYNEKRLFVESVAELNIESFYTSGRMAHHSGLKE